ncbi:helix-turn-helix transcriptional regulator [Exiguobacterium antarcticum]|uniref:Helix-turn-helix transcriptional regulator n=1 Tax=Exiguobacterium antarcticum TaxID=132920 RepID=A0ABT6QZU6_9BACL|nr:helix-turn-helix transcriptional regulator [Exiguobacterium antarcticum]MDI3234211.1 helix-turn-helix transcriptional regulator [Exiguobacterium antarcticum]
MNDAFLALIEFRRKKSKLTRREVAQRLEVDTSTYYRKESGKTEFTATEIFRVISLLGMEKDVEQQIFLNKGCVKATEEC